MMSLDEARARARNARNKSLEFLGITATERDRMMAATAAAFPRVVEVGEIYENDSGDRFLVTLVHKKDLMVAFESLPYDGTSGSAGGPNAQARFLRGDTCGTGMRLVGKMKFNGAHRAYRRERIAHSRTQAKIDKALEVLEVDTEWHSEALLEAIEKAISELRPS